MQEKIKSLIEPWFLFSIIWSIGATCDHEDRIRFSDWLREEVKKHQV